jgi:hypothetical protein
MKLFASLLALSVSILPSALAPSTALSQSSSNANIIGVWQGFATIHDT